MSGSTGDTGATIGTHTNISANRFYHSFQQPFFSSSSKPVEFLSQFYKSCWFILDRKGTQKFFFPFCQKMQKEFFKVSWEGKNFKNKAPILRILVKTYICKSVK